MQTGQTKNVFPRWAWLVGSVGLVLAGYYLYGKYKPLQSTQLGEWKVEIDPDKAADFALSGLTGMNPVLASGVRRGAQALGEYWFRK
jgi:hypothetical protein